MSYQKGLYSKNPEYTGLPEYYDKCKDVYIWIDGKKYLDMSTMGIGACLLGYNNKQVNNAVKRAINNGVFSSINCKEEKELDLLLDDIFGNIYLYMYLKTGGEAVSVAVEIAKNNTDRKEVIQCGYNGYILENQKNKKFEYNNIISFENALSENTGIIVMESIRNDKPDQKFWKTIDNICKKKKIILIIDEITAGFKLNYGGYYSQIKLLKKCDMANLSNDYYVKNGNITNYLPVSIDPDFVVYGKCISNGYPFSMIVGKKDLMQNSNKSFISSTYWTDRIGIVACIETLKQLKKQDYSYLEYTGTEIQNIWKECSKKYGIEIEISEIPQLSHFKFKYNHYEYLTIFVYIMKKYGIIATNTFYPSFKHNKYHIEKYKTACKDAFLSLSEINERPLAWIRNEVEYTLELNIIKELPVKIR